MTQEFTATRMMLANAMATAGAELLQYMKTAGALAAIPNTDPQQYVVAGTLQIIGKLLPAVEGAPAVQAQAELTDERIIEICHKEGLGPCLGLAVGRAIERELRAGSSDVRDQALEEAAKLCQTMYEEKQGGAGCAVAADRIRALKAEAPAASKEGDKA